jgi:hypothetical protein
MDIHPEAGKPTAPTVLYRALTAIDMVEVRRVSLTQ